MNYKLQHLFFLTLIFLIPGSLIFAQTNYVPLIGIPGIDDPALNFGKYINTLYSLSISVAALLAVIKIIIAGMKYMLSDIVTTKSEAISDIKGSVLGLIVVISAVLVLTVINPQLVETNIILDKITITPGAAAPAGPAYAGTPLKLTETKACIETVTPGVGPEGAPEYSYDCTVAVSDCIRDGGKPGTGTSHIQCQYGSELPMPCAVLTDPSGFTYTDCTDAETTCKAKGTPHPKPGSGGAAIICVTPIK